MKQQMMNDVANDKWCDAIDANSDDTFKIICLYFSEWSGITFCSSSDLAQKMMLFR